MANLSRLTLAARRVPVKSDPFEAAKAKLLKNLDGQPTSARAMLDGKPCPEVKRKWYLRDTERKVSNPKVAAHEEVTPGQNFGFGSDSEGPWDLLARSLFT